MYTTPEKIREELITFPSFFSAQLREELQDVERRRYLYSPPRNSSSSGGSTAVVLDPSVQSYWKKVAAAFDTRGGQEGLTISLDDLEERCVCAGGTRPGALGAVLYHDCLLSASSPFDGTSGDDGDFDGGGTWTTFAAVEEAAAAAEAARDESAVQWALGTGWRLLRRGGSAVGGLAYGAAARALDLDPSGLRGSSSSNASPSVHGVPARFRLVEARRLVRRRRLAELASLLREHCLCLDPTDLVLATLNGNGGAGATATATLDGQQEVAEEEEQEQQQEQQEEQQQQQQQQQQEDADCVTFGALCRAAGRAALAKLGKDPGNPPKSATLSTRRRSSAALLASLLRRPSDLYLLERFLVATGAAAVERRPPQPSAAPSTWFGAYSSSSSSGGRAGVTGLDSQQLAPGVMRLFFQPISSNSTAAAAATVAAAAAAAVAAAVSEVDHNILSVRVAAEECRRKQLVLDARRDGIVRRLAAEKLKLRKNHSAASSAPPSSSAGAMVTPLLTAGSSSTSSSTSSSRTVEVLSMRLRSAIKASRAHSGVARSVERSLEGLKQAASNQQAVQLLESSSAAFRAVVDAQRADSLRLHGGRGLLERAEEAAEAVAAQADEVDDIAEALAGTHLSGGLGSGGGDDVDDEETRELERELAELMRQAGVQPESAPPPPPPPPPSVVLQRLPVAPTEEVHHKESQELPAQQEQQQEQQPLAAS